MTPARAQLLLLGIDAASPTLLEAWMEDGTLPNLAGLRARGLGGTTSGIEGFFVGSTWPSLYTGVNPAGHGIHYLLRMDPGSYELFPSGEAELGRREPFWEILSRAGRRVAVLDVPLTRLSPELNGIQVVEWGGHDAVFGFRTNPPELAAEIEERIGSHPHGPSCDATGRTAAEYRVFVEGLEEGVARKGELTRWLLARDGWDLFVQVFTEAHCCGHQCWHLHDTGHPAHDAQVADEVGDPLRRVYRAIDREIGEILEVAGDTTTIVFSGHGMEHWHGAHFLLPEILLRLGVTAPPPEPPRRPLKDAVVGAWRALPSPVRSALRPIRERMRGGTEEAHPRPSLGADPARSRCFVQPNGLAVGGIRINRVGREPRGLVEPGADEESFIEDLVSGLLDIEDERTGRPLISRVRRTADLYAGEYLDHLPDLLVEWSDEVPTGSIHLAGGAGARVRVRSPRIGVVEGVNDYGRTGEHRPGGWFVAAGPGIPAGTLERPVSIMDLAPTVLRLLGVEPGGGRPEIDGRPIEELVRAAT